MTLKTRLWFFPLVGLAAGFLISLYAGVVFTLHALARGPSPAVFGQIVAVYLLGGVAGGLLTAITFPLVRWVGGAFLVGALAVLPMYFGAGLVVDPGPPSQRLLIAGVLALAVGGTAGARGWLDDHRSAYTLAQVWLFAAVCSAVAWIVGLRWAGEWPAALAAFVFLVPVMLALFVTLDRRPTNRRGSAA